MKRLLTILSFITTISFFISCSNDDGGSSVELNGGTILKYQIVTVSLPDTPLPNAEYSGTMAGETITLERSGDSSLVFMVDPNTTTGTTDLVITDLNLTVHYNVQELTLPGTTDVVMSDFFQNENTVLSSLGAGTEEDNLAQSLNGTTGLYNALSADDKLLEAKIYFANKELIDGAMLGYFESGLGKNGLSVNVASQINKQLLTYFVNYHHILFKVGLIPKYFPSVKLMIVRKAIETSQYGLKKTFNRIINGKIIVNDITVNNDAVPTLVDRKVKTLPIKISERNLIQSDSNNESLLIRNFFEEVEIYNQRIDRVNSFLELFPDGWFELLENFNVPTSSGSFERDFDETDKGFTIFTAMTTDGDFISLTSATMASTGQLNVNVSITNNTPTSFPLQAKLYFDFNDEISVLERNLNIRVMPRVNGTWILSKFEETYSPGTYVNYYSSTCPSLAVGQYTINNKVITITESETYSSVENWTNKSYSLSYDSGCNVTSNGTDVTSQGTDNESGTYTFNEDSYTGTTSTGQTYGINFISNNKVKVGDETYTRN